MLRFFAVSISATLGLVLTLGACGAAQDTADAAPGAADATVATDAADAALQKDTGLGGCLCEPPNFSKNPAGCPAALGVQMVLGKPCSTPGLVCSYANNPPCNCGIDVQCRVDPRADAGADDGGDGGASLVWQTGK